MAHRSRYSGREIYDRDRTLPFDQSFAHGQTMYRMNFSNHPGRTMGPPPIPPPIPLDPRLEQYGQVPVVGSGHARNDRVNQGGPRYAERGFVSTSPGDIEAMSRGILPAPPSGDPEPNALLRFWAEPGPWNSEGTQPLGQAGPSQERIPRPSASFVQYREPAKSDPGSHFTGRPSDSGYASKSVLSGDYQDQSQENQSLPGDIGSMQMHHDSRTREYLPSDQQDNQSCSYETWSNDARDPSMSAGISCEYTNCTVVCKSQSEYKKHRLRHEKIFVCDVPNCKRSEGFSTKNDLDRHKKSVHYIMPPNAMDKSFKCAGLNCPKREKIWPRLDNFRSHCIRMHPKEDLDDLAKRSEVDPVTETSTSTTGPRFSVGSRPSATADLNRSRYANRPTYGTEGSIDHISSDLPDEQPHFHRGPASPTIPKATYPYDATTAGDTRQNLNCGISNAHRVPVLERSTTESQTEASRQEEQHQLSLTSQMEGVLPSKATIQDRHGHSKQVSYLPPAQPEILQRPANSSNRGLSPDLNASSIYADEISKVLAIEVANCINQNNSSQEDIELIIKTRVMSLLTQSASRKRKSDETASDDTGQPVAKRVACPTCLKVVARPCDLKKHEKRHTRPWGCTHTNCYKSFGSKNDWKRHEYSQHYQGLETWRCHEPSPASKINQCARLFYQRDSFTAHVRKEHSIQDESYIREQYKSGRIGRNGQCNFWCGFCMNIVKLKTRGVESWDERFNHIDDKHFKLGQRIEDWYPPDKDVPKKELRNDTSSSGSGLSIAVDDSDSEDSERDENSWKKDPPPRRPPPPPPPPLPPPPSSNPTHSPPVQPAISNKTSKQERKLNTHPRKDLSSPSKRKVANKWFCCECGSGPNAVALMLNCLGQSCTHRRCPTCARYE